MVNESLLGGIVAHNIATARIRLNVLVHGADNGVPVIFIHGNTASSRFWEETMCALPPTYRAFAPDMRGYGITERLPVDGSRGLRDWSDDLRALVTTLSLGAVHLVGWSLGGGIGLQYAIDFPDEVRSLTLVDPIPPYGFGGTHGLDGQPNAPDYAGSGGGIVNVEFIKRMAAGDRGGTEPLSPRVVMNTSFFKPPFRVAPEREEIYLSALLETGTGDDFYPGDLTLSPNWPSVAPGTRGFANAFSPKYCNLSGLPELPRNRLCSGCGVPMIRLSPIPRFLTSASSGNSG